MRWITRFPKPSTCPPRPPAALVARVYRDAYALGLKGITIYRSGKRAQQVLQLGIDEELYEKEYRPTCDPSRCKR